ncbi:DUF423 domain-containing protein [Magnetovibrio blakemorei]|uniref:DUF423 domain-containing protein n=1 Tax=Magnetovibrio blakemorei TaxID=28181 RepID=A0A1E5QB88_9PROT|nr:DUF423 domain-containing protein [Magnetovibrio blakemorei]OEJ69296.1 hypothetical protein BEN30_04245 [Magnetovibrio blakemorei]
MNIWILLAGLNGAISVGAGAYGWHALGDTPEIRDVFMMGSQYQMWHAMALVAVGLVIRPVEGRTKRRALHIAGAFFQAGIFLFSGTLYCFGALSMVPVEGAAPVGGGLLILAWLILAGVGARIGLQKAESA